MCRVAVLIGFEENDLRNAKALISKFQINGSTREPESWTSNNSRVTFIMNRFDVTSENVPTYEVPVIGNRFVLSYNGEIFNYKGLDYNEQENKDFLSDLHFASHFIEDEGFHEFFQNADLQGTFCVYDKEEEKCFILVDQFNSAGCFYARWDDKIIVAQEFPIVQKILNEFKPREEENIINIVKNGTFLEIDKTGIITEKVYRDHYKKLWNGANKEFNLSEKLIEIDKILTQAVKSRLPKKGNIGVLCGGGVDSSLILTKVYFLLRQQDELDRLKVFTLGTANLENVKDDELNDLKSTKLLLDHLDLPENKFLKIVSPKFQWYDILLNDEVYDKNPRLITPNPVRTQVRHTIQLSCILATIATEYKNEKIKVLLSGDFADEVFAGYDSMFADINEFKTLQYRVQRKLNDLPLNDAARISLSCFYGAMRLIRKEHIEPKMKEVDSRFRNKIPDLEISQEAFRDIINSLVNIPQKMKETLKSHIESYHPIEIRTPFACHNLLSILSSFPKELLIGKINDSICSKYILRRLALQNNIPINISLRKKIPFNEGGTGIKNGARDDKEFVQANIFFWDEIQLKSKEVISLISKIDHIEKIDLPPFSLKNFEQNIEDLGLIVASNYNGLSALLQGNSFDTNMLATVYPTNTEHLKTFSMDKNLDSYYPKDTKINEDFVQEKFFTDCFCFNIHHAKQQIMYLPLYKALQNLKDSTINELKIKCQNANINPSFLKNIKKIDFSLKSSDNYDMNEYGNDKKIVETLFENRMKKEDDKEIDLFLTGEKDIADFYKTTEKNDFLDKIIHWTTLIQHLPVQLIKPKNLKTKTNNMYTSDYKKEKVYTFPQNTTVYHYVNHFYESLYKEILGVAIDDIEKKIIDDECRGLVTEIKNPKLVEREEGFSPHFQPIPFTCVYSQKEIFKDENKKNLVHLLCFEIQQQVFDLYKNLGEIKLLLLKNNPSNISQIKFFEKKVLSNTPPYCLKKYNIAAENSKSLNIDTENLLSMAQANIWGVELKQ